MAFFSARLLSLRHWPTASQQISRRNAMIACTALSAHRAQVLEVDAFIARSVLPRAEGRVSAHG
ncbi:hypothetical protein [Nocardioides sp.]|uniref:hypothetical protein n=1 Tax=Nocardioides sp. TaxID=35761 RepID=UPI003D1524DB